MLINKNFIKINKIFLFEYFVEYKAKICVKINTYN